MIYDQKNRTSSDRLVLTVLFSSSTLLESEEDKHRTTEKLKENEPKSISHVKRTVQDTWNNHMFQNVLQSLIKANSPIIVKRNHRDYYLDIRRSDTIGTFVGSTFEDAKEIAAITVDLRLPIFETWRGSRSRQKVGYV